MHQPKVRTDGNVDEGKMGVMISNQVQMFSRVPLPIAKFLGQPLVPKEPKLGKTIFVAKDERGKHILTLDRMKSIAVSKKKKARHDYQPLRPFGGIGTPEALMPPALELEMPYLEAVWVTANGVAGVTIRRQANALYDPDPAVGGSSYVGLSKWATIYNYYRVVSYTYEYDVINLEANPIVIEILNTNTDPGTSAYANPQLLGNAVSHHRILGPVGAGNSQHTFRGSINLLRVLGSDSVLVEESYRGLTASANPADLFWITVSAVATGGNTLTTNKGMTAVMKLRARAILYDRVAITS